MRRSQILSAGALALLPLLPATSSAAVIDFATLGGANGSPFTSYTENGFTVATSAGQFFAAQSFGNPIPSIFAGPAGGGPTADSLLLTRAGGGDFSFDTFDLSANNGVTQYTLTGTLGGAPVFSVSSSLSPPLSGFAFSTITPGTNADIVDAVTLAFTTAGTSFNVDNIAVAPANAPVPEPASLALLGTGLLGLGMIGRRKVT